MVGLSLFQSAVKSSLRPMPSECINSSFSFAFLFSWVMSEEKLLVGHHATTQHWARVERLDEQTESAAT